MHGRSQVWKEKEKKGLTNKTRSSLRSSTRTRLPSHTASSSCPRPSCRCFRRCGSSGASAILLLAKQARDIRALRAGIHTSGKRGGGCVSGWA